jgi:hypothetical protein
LRVRAEDAVIGEWNFGDDSTSFSRQSGQRFHQQRFFSPRSGGPLRMGLKHDAFFRGFENSCSRRKLLKVMV